MKRDELTAREIFFAALAVLVPLGYALGMAEKNYGSNAFLYLAAACLPAVVALWLWASFRRAFAREGLGEVCLRLCGCFGGRLCLTLCILTYLAAVLAFVLAAALLWQEATGMDVFTFELLFLLLVFYGGLRRTVSVGRLANVLIFIGCICFAAALAVGLFRGDFALLPPIYKPDVIEFAAGSLSFFGCGFGLLAVLPWFFAAVPLKQGPNQKDNVKTALWAAGITALVLFALVMLRDLSNLGESVCFWQFPGLALARNSVGGRGFGHPEDWTAVVLLVWLCVGSIVLVLALLKSSAAIWRPKKSWGWAVLWWLVLAAYLGVARPGIDELRILAMFILPVLGVLTGLFLPAFLLLKRRSALKHQMKAVNN